MDTAFKLTMKLSLNIRTITLLTSYCIPVCSKRLSPKGTSPIPNRELPGLTALFPLNIVGVIT